MRHRIILTVAFLAAVVFAVPGTATAAPKITPHTAQAGSEIRYEFTSDTTLNTIRYYGPGGKIVTRNSARFVPLPVGFSREKYGLTVKFRAAKRQPAGSQITSREQYATCKVTVRNRTVDYRRELFRGFANC